MQKTSSENTSKNEQSSESILTDPNRIILVGAPNVGKSVFFTSFTEKYAVSSNFTNTTVSYTEGKFHLGDNDYTLIDVPGTYSLEAISDAERVAVEFIDSNPDAAIFIFNAADLEGSIKLFLEFSKNNIPTVGALNLLDVAERQGKEIDKEKLEAFLGIPIIPTVAVKGTGLNELKEKLSEVVKNKDDFLPNQTLAKKAEDYTASEFWDKAGELTEEVVSQKSDNLSVLDKLGEALTKPWPGVPIALLIILLSLGVVVGLGKALRATLLLPLVNDIIVPLFETFFGLFGMPEIAYNILIGEYGIFRIGFEWPIALIFPYILIFQAVFAFLEDSGILPRFAVLFDNLMSKIGIQGGSLLNLMMAFGCAVPAIIGTRAATTQKERLLVTTIICFTIPCISQTGAILSLLGDYSFWLVIAVFLTGFLFLVATAKVGSKILPGEVDPMVIEIPNLLIPNAKAYAKKLFIRLKGFTQELAGPILIAVIIAAVITESGALSYISYVLKPVVSSWLGLPEEASLSLLLGIIRREMSVAPLLALDLEPIQMYVGAVVSLLYIPCLSVYAILAREFNNKTALAIIGMTVVNAILLGGILNHSIRFVLGLF